MRPSVIFSKQALVSSSEKPIPSQGTWICTCACSLEEVALKPSYALETGFVVDVAKVRDWSYKLAILTVNTSDTVRKPMESPERLRVSYVRSMVVRYFVSAATRQSCPCGI